MAEEAGDIRSLVRGARLDHVAVAVRDLAGAAALFRDTLGAEFLFGSDVPGQAFRAVYPSANARGVLVQLAESPHSDDDTARHFADLFPEAALLDG